jgi:hypothetical protein
VKHAILFLTRRKNKRKIAFRVFHSLLRVPRFCLRPSQLQVQCTNGRWVLDHKEEEGTQRPVERRRKKKDTTAHPAIPGRLSLRQRAEGRVGEKRESTHSDGPEEGTHKC